MTYGEEESYRVVEVLVSQYKTWFIEELTVAT